MYDDVFHANKGSLKKDIWFLSVSTCMKYIVERKISVIS